MSTALFRPSRRLNRDHRVYSEVQNLESRRLLTSTISINAELGQRSIDPRIYGVAFATPAELADLNIPFNRYGGNTSSTYNWQLNAHNTAADFYWESVPDGPRVASDFVDSFVTDNRTQGAASNVTVPLMDWVANLGPSNVNGGKLASFSIQKYGAQTDNDSQFFPDAGNGILSANGMPITGNDPTDAYVRSFVTHAAAGMSPPTGSVFQEDFINHLGGLAGGGAEYYSLDNEPSLWHETHRDIHPDGATMDEVFAQMQAYAAMVKSIDPSAKVVGPDEWGWSGYFYSGADQQYFKETNDYSMPPPDQAAHGGADYLPWLLDQFRQYDQSNGQRLLDVFSVHYYPQGGEFSNDNSPAMQLLRNQSTRALWDPNYVDQSWIMDKVMLIPRLQGWVDAYYPGTEVGLTEYNWGAEAYMNGATTQADILGIFGREGLDLANRWTTPDPSTPTYKAIQMYRNYDGNSSTFGDVSVQANVANPDQVSAFASVRTSDGALTIIVINKGTAAESIQLDLSGYNSTGTAHVWQLSASHPNVANDGSISHLSDVTTTQLANGSVSLPGQSVTMYVLDPQFVSPDDVLLFDEASRTFRLGANTGNSFNWFQTNTLPTTNGGYDSFVGDFDGDGDLDGAVRNRDTRIVNVYFNQGDGTLTGPVNKGTAGTVGTPAFFQLGDYDGNGREELLWLYTDGQYAGQVFTKDLMTSATFNMVKANPSYDAFITGDFNADGFDDLVGLFDNASGTRTTIIPFFSIASAKPGAPRRLRPLTVNFVQGSFGRSVVTDGLTGFRAADLNGDGRDDIIAVTTAGSAPGQVLHATTTGNVAGDGVIFQNVHGFVSSARAPQYAPASFSGPVLLGQFDGNSFADSVSVSNSGEFFVGASSLNMAFLNPVLLSNPAVRFGAGMTGMDYVVGDFNGDGFSDLAGLGLHAYIYLSAGFGNAFGAVRDFGTIIGGKPGHIGAVRSG